MKDISDIKNSRVLFVTTKNLDYLRNTQEIELLKAQGNDVSVIGSQKKGYLGRLIKVYGKLMLTKIKDFDYIFIGFAPQLVLPFLKHKLKKKPVVIDFFISLYDTLVFDRKKFREGSFFARFFHKLDKKTLSLADFVICDTKAHGKYFCSEFSYPEDRIQTLYLEADRTIYYPREAPANDKFTVLYFGSILPLQGVDVILGAIEKLKNEKGIRFEVIGPIPEKMQKTGTDITEYIPWLSQEALAEKIAGADLCLAGHFDCERDKAKRTIPGKAYIYAAMNKPMILGDNPATRELYSETEDIFFVKMGDSDALAEKIMEIANKKLC